MIIYAEQTSPRLEYVIQFLTLFYNTPVQLTTEVPEASSVFINYSVHPHPYSVQIKPHPILFEDIFYAQHTEVSYWEETPCFFKTQENGPVECDILAATFYMLSRYEEYLPFKADAHGRFPATESLAYKHEFLELPVVDLWWYKFSEVFKNSGGILAINRNYTFIQTVDIDKAYAYKYQVFPYNFLLFFKAVLDGKGAEYLLTLENKRKDPFDVYDILDEVHAKHKAVNIYFILSGKRGAHDKNLPVSSAGMRKLLERLKSKSSIGLHPSYESNGSLAQLNQELKLLQKATGLPIKKSRQHYLKLTFPDTFTKLEEAGITEDYSLGFADYPGFRAGTCTPFYFYNLKTETVTNLKLFPLILMDVTLSRYLNLSKDVALRRSISLIDQVKKVNGCFISLWHNSSFSEIHQMQGWESVFEEMVKYASNYD